EKAIRDIFKKAKNVSPCILFFDEIDSLTQNKEDLIGGGPKVLDQLLTELDNVSLKDIIFIAATNRPDLIDKSFLRSGRIDKIIEFKIPSAKERKEIIDLLIKKTPHEKININLIVEETDGFVGADLSLLITDATLLAIKQNKYKETKLKEEHIITILKKMKSHNKGGKNKASDDFRNDKSIAKYIQ
ncbi:MAG: ATP-binding protein, partial [archaeon]